MISKFSVIYTGAIDLGNVGRDGTPADERRYSNERLVEALYNSEALAEHLDKLGYYALWGAEHHFQREGYECIPNLILWAVHLAGRTRNLKFGCAFNIIPTWHPIRLAEDFAMADVFTRGRVIFGVGRGYQSREVEGLGAPLLDSDANRELYEESLEIILKAWNSDSFRHDGKHYTIPPRVPYRGYELDEITLVPRPLQRPVECWQPIVSASQRGLDFMARYGIKGIIGGGAASGGANEKVIEAWRETLAHHGRETALGGDLTIGFSFHLADTEEQAIREATPYFEENMKMFAPLGFVRGLTADQMDAVADPLRARQASLPTLRDAIKAGAWFCGPPALIAAKLMEVQDKYPGLTAVNVGQVIGTPKRVILEQLEWFGREVMPAFKRQARATPAAVG